MTERDDAARAARERFLQWYGKLMLGDDLEIRVAQQPDENDDWRVEIRIINAEGALRWWVYYAYLAPGQWMAYTSRRNQATPCLPESDAWGVTVGEAPAALGE